MQKKMKNVKNVLVWWQAGEVSEQVPGAEVRTSISPGEKRVERRLSSENLPEAGSARTRGNRDMPCGTENLSAAPQVR
jgi:hypothetical protein